MGTPPKMGVYVYVFWTTSSRAESKNLETIKLTEKTSFKVLRLRMEFWMSET